MPAYITDLLTPNANITARSSLRASFNGKFVVGLATATFVSLHHVYGTDFQQNLNSYAALQLLGINSRYFSYSHHMVCMTANLK